jgi:predicted acyltransferase (DUF342 family)
MKPNLKWIIDWQIGENPTREAEVSSGLMDFFADFWESQGLSHKGKTTINRYASSLYVIGGYLVEQAISDDGRDMTINELLSEYIDSDGGPLIHHDNESWQSEIDMVSRKLFKFINK